MEKRDLVADLALLERMDEIFGDSDDDDFDFIRDVVLKHALKRAIVAEEEVDRLKKEIEQRKAINQKAIKVMMSATSDNERLRQKMDRNQSQLEVIRECLEPLISKVDYQTRARLSEVMRYVQNGLQLTKGESGGTRE